MERRTVIVMPIEGNDFGCDSLRFVSDTLKGYDHDTQMPVKIPLSNVFEIIVTDVWRGDVRGFFTGSAIGGGVGLFVGTIHPFTDEYSYEALEGCALLGALGGIWSGSVDFSTYHYRFGEKEDYSIERETQYKLDKHPALYGVPPSQVVTLLSWPLHEETQEAISILWEGKPIWPLKFKIEFERLAGGKINLAVPKSLLEAPQEK
jgi:hypothetical protein